MSRVLWHDKKVKNLDDIWMTLNQSKIIPLLSKEPRIQFNVGMLILCHDL